VQTRCCKKCQTTKPIEDFGKDSRRDDGVSLTCKACAREKHRNWKAKNPGYAAAWRKANPEKLAKQKSDWAARNTEKVRGWVNDWLSRNRQWKIDYEAARRAAPRAKVDASISSSINQCLKNGSKSGRSWESLVGYTIDELMSHLEKQFSDGMTWGNYGKNGWEIDHIIPKSIFNYESPEHIDFKRCWSLSNLQPLWADENRKKWATFDGGFQPSLAI
jgi:hypothetical protein